MRALEPWVSGPLATFLSESSARLALVMTGAGQVVAQHGFTRALDVMSAAALGAAIVSSTEALARLIGCEPFRTVVHQGTEQGLLLGAFETRRGRWIALVVFDRDTPLGLVQLFYERLVADLVAAAPAGAAPKPALAADFERELNASLRALFGR